MLPPLAMAAEALFLVAQNNTCFFIQFQQQSDQIIGKQSTNSLLLPKMIDLLLTFDQRDDT